MASEWMRTSGFPGLSALSNEAALELEKARILARHLSRLLDLWAAMQSSPRPGQAYSDAKDVPPHSVSACCKRTRVGLQCREETGVG